MAKKNFDDFVNAAGKRKKPSPEEVDELSQIIHPTTAAGVPVSEPIREQPAVLPPKTVPAAAPRPVLQKTRRGKPSKRTADAAPSEKVRITVDLAKDLYKRMKMQLVHEEIDISTYVRDLIERDLSRK